MKKILSLIMCLLIIGSSLISLAGCGNGYDENCKNTEYNLTDNIADGSILHCFCWDFETITNSMEDIAAAGYSTIQTSPINECFVGDGGGMQLFGKGKWYYHFQPVDYTIGNYQLGTREEFKKMCEKADEYGIKVIVDVVPNHTSFTISAVKENLLNAVGGIEKLYHKNAAYDIIDYGNRLDCTTKKMGGLPDIDTENKDFQDYFIKYINDCIECGADGFRYDCAKHIALPDDPVEKKGDKNNFWTRVTTEIKNADKIFNYGEVLQGTNDRIGDYIDTIGQTTASSYGENVRNAIINNRVHTADILDLRLGSNDCVTWVESHDNYINDGNWMYMSDEQVVLAYAIIASRSAGTPMFFNRPYGSSNDSQWGTMNRIGTSGNYTYKDKSVVAVNFFRNAMAGEEEQLFNCDEDAKSIQICRGDKGAVIVNLADELNVDFETNLADGKYLDRVDNKTIYKVKDGKITCKTPISKNQIVVLYNEGYTQFATPATVKISDDVSCMYDTETVKVKLECSNADEAFYSIDNQKKIKFSNGDTITIDSKKAKDGITNLVLTATSPAGQKTYMRYCFTNTNASSTGAISAKKGDVVYFKKPDTWGENINAYIYTMDGTAHNSDWPGLPMEESGDVYKYTFTRDWENSLIMFNDGEQQFPEANMEGLAIEVGKTYEAH